MANLASITFKTLKAAKQLNFLTNININYGKFVQKCHYSAQVEFLDTHNLGPLEVLNQKIRDGELMHDEQQLRVTQQLQKVFEDIEDYTPQEQSIFNKWFSTKQEVPQGLYIHGSVGGGKTMLMDLFYNCCDVSKLLYNIISIFLYNTSYAD